jgi:hypothetical protein
MAEKVRPHFDHDFHRRHIHSISLSFIDPHYPLTKTSDLYDQNGMELLSVCPLCYFDVELGPAQEPLIKILSGIRNIEVPMH